MYKESQFLDNGDVVEIDGRNATVISVGYLRNGVVCRIRLDVVGIGEIQVISPDVELWPILSQGRED